MIPRMYRLVALGDAPSGRELSEFVAGIEHIRRSVDVPSLEVRKLRSTAVNEGLDDPEVMRLPIGNRFTVELKGDFVPTQNSVGRKFAVWAQLVRSRFGSECAMHVHFEKLCVGIVEDVDPSEAAGDELGDMFDITRDTFHQRNFMQPALHIAGFPREWRQLVMAQVTAKTLGWFLDHRGSLPG